MLNDSSVSMLTSMEKVLSSIVSYQKEKEFTNAEDGFTNCAPIFFTTMVMSPYLFFYDLLVAEILAGLAGASLIAGAIYPCLRSSCCRKTTVGDLIQWKPQITSPLNDIIGSRLDPEMTFPQLLTQFSIKLKELGEQAEKSSVSDDDCGRVKERLNAIITRCNLQTASSTNLDLRQLRDAAKSAYDKIPTVQLALSSSLTAATSALAETSLYSRRSSPSQQTENNEPQKRILPTIPPPPQ